MYKTSIRLGHLCLQELCRRWEQFVLDHQAYIQAFEQCRAWLGQMKGKVSAVVDTSGDKSTVQERLAQVQVKRRLLSQVT